MNHIYTEIKGKDLLEIEKTYRHILNPIGIIKPYKQKVLSKIRIDGTPTNAIAVNRAYEELQNVKKVSFGVKKGG